MIVAEQNRAHFKNRLLRESLRREPFTIIKAAIGRYCLLLTAEIGDVIS
jgi:hypothetical protein